MSYFDCLLTGHHIYTNVMGVDPDLPVAEEGDIRRVCLQQKWLPVYRFQHVYLCFLYGFLSLKFRLQDITCTIIDHSNGNIRVNDLGWKETTGQILSKVITTVTILSLANLLNSVIITNLCTRYV